MQTHDDTLVRYLLGEASAEEETRLEQEYLASPEALERLTMVEDELIDEYVRGHLQEARRIQFEARFLNSPRRRQRVEFARHLAGYVATHPARASVAETAQPLRWASVLSVFSFKPVTQLAMAATLVLLLGIALVLFVERRQLRSELVRGERERVQLAERAQRQREPAAVPQVQTPKPDTPSTSTPAGAPGSSPSRVIALSLSPGLVRGEATTASVPMPKDAAVLRLRLYIEDDEYPEYRATIETARGRQVFSRDKLRAPRAGRADTVTVDVPASVMRSGSYVLTLSGRRGKGEFVDLASYAFAVR